MTAEHPFAQYVRILGKGPNLSRPLTREETRTAVGMVLRGEVEPVQLGAFLCLLRVKTETPEEVAGFVEAIRDFMGAAPAASVDLDWPSYAGKARRLPWYVLSALLLAENGLRVFMHGAEGHTANRVYTSQAFAALGLPVATSLDEAARHIGAHNLGYMRLEHLCPRLHEVMGLRALLGLRSPIHTVARMINPFRAPAEVVSVAHPNYRNVHQEAALLLGQPNLAVFKGEGGEAERRPEKPCLVQSLHGDSMRHEDWPPLVTEAPRYEEELDLSRLAAVWRGVADDPYAAATVAGTAAIALRLTGRAASIEEADGMARAMWEGRRRDRLAGAA